MRTRIQTIVHSLSTKSKGSSCRGEKKVALSGYPVRALLKKRANNLFHDQGKLMCRMRGRRKSPLAAGDGRYEM